VANIQPWKSLVCTLHCVVVFAMGSETKVAILATEPNAIRLQLVELRKKTYHVIPESYVVVIIIIIIIIIVVVVVVVVVVLYFF